MKLADFMTAHGLGPSEMAKRLGVNHATVIRYRDSQRRPDSDVMARIFEVTNGSVTPNDFYDFVPTPAPSEVA